MGFVEKNEAVMCRQPCENGCRKVAAAVTPKEQARTKLINRGGDHRRLAR